MDFGPSHCRLDDEIHPGHTGTGTLPNSPLLGNRSYHYSTPPLNQICFPPVPTNDAWQLLDPGNNEIEKKKMWETDGHDSTSSRNLITCTQRFKYHLVSSRAALRESVFPHRWFSSCCAVPKNLFPNPSAAQHRRVEGLVFAGRDRSTTYLLYVRIARQLRKSRSQDAARHH